jgi:hypothetical protein
MVTSKDIKIFATRDKVIDYADSSSVEIRYIDTVIPCFEDAKAYLRSLNTKWKCGVAVPFYKYGTSRVLFTGVEVLDKINEKIDDLTLRIGKLIQDNHVCNREGDYICCDSCGSSIARKWFEDAEGNSTTDNCPVCGSDMRVIDIRIELTCLKMDLVLLEDQYKTEVYRQLANANSEIQKHVQWAVLV